MCVVNRWVQGLDEAEPGGGLDHETWQGLSLWWSGGGRVSLVVGPQWQRIAGDAQHRRQEVCSSLDSFAE